MRRDISKAEVERLFVGAVDGDLAENDRSRLDTAIESDESLKTDFDKYERAVKLLRESPREEAPDVLASILTMTILREAYALAYR